MKIVVYTAIAGDCGDKLYPPLDNSENIKYYCFSDSNIEPNGYELLTFPWHSDDLRRKSRYPKLNSHIVFPDADITIWHDAIYQAKDINLLLTSLGDNYEFCSFKHSRRTTIAEETYACISQKKDDPKLLMTQCQSYLKQGMRGYNHLFENSCLVRRSTDKVKEINNLWWSEYQKWSCRDQISLPYVFWKLNYNNFTIIDGKRHDNPYFIFREHGHD